MDKFTYKDVVDRFWGPCSDEDAHTLLINATAYPFAPWKHIARQLRDMRKRTDNIGEAMAIADREMEEEMQKFHDKEKAERMAEQMAKQTKKYGIYHWDTFDNVTLLVAETNNLREAKKMVAKKYKDRLSLDGADRVDIVDKKGDVKKAYHVR